MALGGWLKLHRSLADHPVASDPSSLAVWMHLLMQANHAETKRQINGRIVTLAPGQLIASRKSLAARTGVQESKVERILKMLEREQQIEQHGTSKYRVISILNWGSYQTSEQQDEQQVNSKRTADEQQVNTPEEALQAEEGKEPKKPPKPPAGGDEGFDQFWLAYPNKKGKEVAKKAWSKIKPNEYLLETILIAVEMHKKSADWQKSGGQFIPHPATWLNGRRWEDEISRQPASASKHTGFADRDYHQGLFEKEDGNYGF